jgi:hypothetical protein
LLYFTTTKRTHFVTRNPTQPRDALGVRAASTVTVVLSLFYDSSTCLISNLSSFASVVPRSVLRPITSKSPSRRIQTWLLKTCGSPTFADRRHKCVTRRKSGLIRNHVLLDTHFTVYGTHQALIHTLPCFPFIFNFPPSISPPVYSSTFPVSSSPRDQSVFVLPLYSPRA